ncbi:translation initiation factor IF-2 N-terminal domain-containing protein [Saccharopolyspora mangrovi]|uniref:Translation initiation factor IF-2 N-terminal domain-containing protein n=1 Tax=Saccharopolyspora mangrovi TaxID=3082379 RepID=A0ABU6A8Y6_9PSEU|nr:translation initiation factor IF-2 N-terminal domain-containing protein [Saccharopolyspora sp. S2-29]MEB3367969.1 translation initiation factor IF-2 N-terminal domain-containing protein [Saccharopolyspora sp. S2-29]
MLNMDTPAGNNASGQSPTPTQEEQGTIELPAKLRVHALAKLLGASSREVIKALDEIGEPVRSAQSNINRDVALRVVQALNPEMVADDGAEAAEAAPASEEPAPEETAEPAGTEQSAAVPAADFAPAPASDSQDSSAGGLTPLFAAPEAMFLAPQPPAQRPAAEPEAEAEAEAAPAPAEEPAAAETSSSDEEQAESAEGDDDSSDSGSRRRRRRGRRGRGRGRGADSDNDSGGEDGAEDNQSEATKTETSGESSEESSDEQSGDAEGQGEGSRRRRRRRRRKGSSDDESGTREDDPPNTVVHVREPAPESTSRQDSSDDEVRAVKGSTRLEAKRQRRRDGREAGRRRAPVLSESEFLARRESVDRKMVVRQNGDQTQIAVLEDNVLVENFVTSSGSGSLVGNVYLGRVQNVLPSMEAAFVDIGRGRNAVLYAGEVDWDAAGLAGKARRIEQALQTGDSVLVQVTKDPVGHKGARLTTQISLPGRFLVYVPGGGATGISRKLPDNERKRLKEILKRIVPENAGVIIRTASEGTSEEALDRDVRRLQAQWEVIKEKAETPGANAPQLLYEEPDLLIKVVRDLFTEDFSSMTVQGNDAWETIEAYVQHVAPDLASRLEKHVGKNDVFHEKRINEQIAKALDRKVWLPSGGYLVIDRTEAMTVIDVNTGKFTGSGGNLEETVTRNNLEAAEEIVRQLRLRDIGGIIVIDFIDMVLESNRDLVLRRLTECLGRDRTRHQVAEVTSLGLVQMTRKRVGTGLLEAYSSTCEHCRGRGLMVSTEPINHQHGGGGGNGQNGGGNGGGGRRNRNRGKQQDAEQQQAPEVKAEQKAEPKAEAKADSKPEPKQESKPEPKAEPKVEERKPEPKPEPAPVEAKPAEPEPAKQPEPETAKPEPAKQPEPVAEAKPQVSEAPKAPVEKQPEPQESANGARPRRKAVRSAGSAGAPAQPLVVSKPAEPKSAEDGLANIEPAAPARRVRRRAVSRPSGPPVEG